MPKVKAAGSASTLPCENVSLLRSNYKWEDAPDEEKYSECVHCGMCLEACPTYQQTGLEAHSPRGRVYLIKSVAEGKMELNEFFANPVDTCLDCRACETACPAGVQVGALIEEARGQLHKANPPRGWSGMLHHLFLHQLFPFPNRMHRLQQLIRLYQRTGLRRLSHQLRIMRLLPKHLANMERALPTISRPPVLGNTAEWLPALGPQRARVAVLTGCVMDVVYSDINEATIRVLRHNGCEVWIPQEQRCCGALHVHAGDRDMAKKLARLNIEAFLAEDVDAIIINAAGCGSTLKEYDELLKNDPAFQGRAAEFVHKVTDVSQFLVKLGIVPPTVEVDLTVTYHDACHLAHAQKIREEPRKLLEAIPGLRIVQLPEADRCCGSAGIYNITHPEMANELLERKLADIPQGCDAVAMGNPGCMMQFQMGIIVQGRKEQVVHTIQLLDWAYGGKA